MHTTKNPATIFPLRQYGGGEYDMFICMLVHKKAESKNSSEDKATDSKCYDLIVVVGRK